MYITTTNQPIMLDRPTYSGISHNCLVYRLTLNALKHMRQKAPTSTCRDLTGFDHKRLSNSITYYPATTWAINTLIKIMLNQLFKRPSDWQNKFNPLISHTHRLIVTIQLWQPPLLR